MFELNNRCKYLKQLYNSYANEYILPMQMSVYYLYNWVYITYATEYILLM